MTATVRLEWVEGPSPTTIGFSAGTAQDLSVTSPTVTVSSAAPTFQGLNGYVRLLCTSGAVVAAIGSSVAANSGVVVNTLTGPVILAVQPGQTIALMEDSTYAITVSAGGGTSNGTTFNGTVTVSNFPAQQNVAGNVAVTNFPAVQSIVGSKLNDGSQSSIGGTHVTVGGVDQFDNYRPLALYASPDTVHGIPTNTTTAVLFADDFGGSTVNTTTYWTVLDGGLGTLNGVGSNSVYGQAQSNIGSMIAGAIGYSVSNSALTVTLPTGNSGAELWFLAKPILAGNEDITFIAKKTVYDANVSIFFGIVEVDPVTGWPVANPNVTGEFNNRGGIEWGKSAGTSQIYGETIADGSSTLTSISQTSWPPSNLATTFEGLMEFQPEDIILSAVSPDTINARSSTAIRVSSQIPNNRKAYRFIMRFRNIGSVTSSTQVTVQRILIVNSFDQRVEIISGRGDNIAAKGVPVNITASNNVLGVAAQINPATNSGQSPSNAKIISASTTPAGVVKAALGRIYGGQICNFNTSLWRYVKFYNQTTTPTVGSGSPLITLAVPPNSTVNIGDALAGPIGILFSVGISYTVTGAVADADTTAITAGDILMNVVYF